MSQAILPPQTVESRISDQEFQAIRQLVYRNFGINLTEQKKTLVVGRLQKVLKARGFETFHDYIQWLGRNASADALEELANNISTNHTFFYREKAHFEYFSRKILPELTAQKDRSGDRVLRIWCAGCSSGEEPYTLMMLMLEHLGPQLSRWNPRLLATDLSARILKRAMRGVYEEESVADLPSGLRSKYFQRAGDDLVSVSDTIRSRVDYRRHNLMDQKFPFTRPFDAIFCRNVMIYFDRDTRNALVAKFHQHTAKGGHLFIGHSESLGRGETEYQYVMPAVYRRAP